MNAIELARQAYAPTSFPLKSERELETQLIGQVTARLKKAASQKDCNFPAFVEALNQNRKLWKLFAIDVAGDDNGLPKKLRAQIFYLAEFTGVHTKKILRGDADETPLLEINASILRGLNGGQGGRCQD